MNKTLARLSVIFLFLALAGAGCGVQNNSNANQPAAPAQTMQQNIDTISQAIASGDSVKCDVTAQLKDQAQQLNMTYFVKGKNLRMESTIQGMNQVVIVKDDQSYIKGSSFPGATGCDWIQNQAQANAPSQTQPEQPQVDYDYKKYENSPDYKIICQRTSFGDEQFTTDGKVCSMQDLMNSMMHGIVPNNIPTR